MAISISEYVTKYTQIAETILASGPDIQADLDDLKLMADAARRIYERTIKRFGLSGACFLTEEEVQALGCDPEVVAVNEKLVAHFGLGAEGVNGPFLDALMQIVQLAISNPQFLTFILSMFKKP